MPNQTAPGDVANTLVRYLLTQAGLAAGGLTAKGPNNQWQATLAAFGHRCAYTGADLTKVPVEKEHAVAINRTSGGLHVYGNVIPSTKEANADKKGLRYDTFLRSKGEGYTSIAHLTDEDREAAIVRIESFMQKARPDGLLNPHPELLAFYQTQYEAAKTLCVQAREQLQALLEKLQLDEAPVDGDATSGLLDLPSVEQLEMEEESANNLPPTYQALQTQYQDHGIGAYAQAVFRELFADGRIAPYLDNLTYREDSFMHFNLSYPAFTTRRQDDPARYYAPAFLFGGTEYYLCSQWYERNRDHLDNWLEIMVFGQSA